jgi:hypothetical protein
MYYLDEGHRAAALRRENNAWGRLLIRAHTNSRDSLRLNFSTNHAEARGDLPRYLAATIIMTARQIVASVYTNTLHIYDHLECSPYLVINEVTYFHAHAYDSTYFFSL